MTQYIKKSALVAEVERLISEIYGGQSFDSLSREKQVALWYVKSIMSSIDTLEVKEVDFERELSKYVSEGIHRFFPGVEDDYCTMDSVVWQDYVIETAEHFFELGFKAQKGK